MISLLIVEDEKAARNTLVNCIHWEKIGITDVYEADNGVTGLEAAKKHAPNIIITDIKMPKMSGIEMIENYKKENHRCKVVFLTAYGDLEYYKAALYLHAFGYIEKPIEPESILFTIGDAATEVSEEQSIDFLLSTMDTHQLKKESDTESDTDAVFFNDEKTENKLVDKALRYIDTHYADSNLCLSSIASEIYISQNYLSVLFKRKTQNTVNHHITEIRMKHAKRLLRESTMSLIEIAGKTGYQNANYFSKVFKSHFGLSPKEYRRSL